MINYERSVISHYLLDHLLNNFVLLALSDDWSLRGAVGDWILLLHRLMCHCIIHEVVFDVITVIVTLHDLPVPRVVYKIPAFYFLWKLPKLFFQLPFFRVIVEIWADDAFWALVTVRTGPHFVVFWMVFKFLPAMTFLAAKLVCTLFIRFSIPASYFVMKLFGFQLGQETGS